MAKAHNRPSEMRGSQKLLANLTKNGAAPSLAEIKRALSLPASVDLKVPKWLVRGIPPVYLEWNATLQVPVAQASTVLEQFISLNDSAVVLHIFINGIPVLDTATIVVQNTP
jgi:hypothetical protein